MGTAAVQYDWKQDPIELGSFTLVVDGHEWQEMSATWDEFRDSVTRRFRAKHALVSLAYELVIEETDVRSGSRRSKVTGRLQKRRGGWTVDRWIAILGIALTLGFGDYDVAKRNYEKLAKDFHEAVITVEHAMSTKGKPVHILDYQPPLTPPPPRRPPEDEV